MSSLQEPHAARARTRCPRCGQHFSPDGRFCPFDGEALVSAEAWDPKGDPLLGRVIDARYEVEALIGEGGMGSVYRVRHVRLGRRFALKALRRDLSSDSDVRERFIQEAKTAGKVAHPGLVRISDFGHLPDGRPFFVMELLEGLSLQALLAQGALSPARAGRIARHIAEALAVAHEAGIVHRDLKPDNVQVGEGDSVTVMDFGLAVAIERSPKVTRSSLAFGSPHYMSPEQAAGAPVDGRTDVYALGVVLYEMLTGRVPFDAETSSEVLRQHQGRAPVPPSQLLRAEARVAALEAVVLACLAKRPEDRYATLTEVARALDEAVPASLARQPARARARNSAGGRPRLFSSAPVWLLGLCGGLFTAGAALVILRFVAPREGVQSARGIEVAADLAAGRSAPADPTPELSPVTPAPVLPLGPVEPGASAAADSGRESGAGRESTAASTKKPAPRRAVPAAGPRSPVRDEIVDPWSR